MEISGLIAGGGLSTSGWGGFGNAAATSSGSGVDWTQVLTGGINALGGYLTSRNLARSGFVAPAIPAGIGGVLAGGGLLGGLLGAGGGSGVMTSSTPGVFAGGPLDAFRPDFYVAGSQSYRARKLIPVQSPNGSISYWRHVGQPVAFSGDQGHCRRLAKVARKLGGGARSCGTKSRRRR